MNQDIPSNAPPAPPQTSGMAISSLVLGITSFMCWVITGLPAVILGFIALGKINRSQGRLTGSGMAITGIVLGGVSTLLIIPLMIALLLPAVQAAREAARRNVAMNNMKMISLALQNYHDTKRSFPAAGGGQGEGAGLSWRVHLLPFMEQQNLYQQFHLDEPWDSEHNRSLIKFMPQEYKDPSGKVAEGKTTYLAVTGPNTFFDDGTTKKGIRDISDGTSNTVFFVEADPEQAVEWTKPEDLKFDPNDPLKGVGHLRFGGFLAAFGDSHVSFISNDVSPETLKALMTPNGGEAVQSP